MLLFFMINVCGKSLNIKGIKFVGSVYYNDFCMKEIKKSYSWM